MWKNRVRHRKGGSPSCAMRAPEFSFSMTVLCYRKRECPVRAGGKNGPAERQAHGVGGQTACARHKQKGRHYRRHRKGDILALFWRHNPAPDTQRRTRRKTWRQKGATMAPVRHQNPEPDTGQHACLLYGACMAPAWPRTAPMHPFPGSPETRTGCQCFIPRKWPGPSGGKSARPHSGSARPPAGLLHWTYIFWARGLPEGSDRTTEAAGEGRTGRGGVPLPEAGETPSRKGNPW